MVITVIPVPRNQAGLLSTFIGIFIHNGNRDMILSSWYFLELHNILLFFYLVIQRSLFKVLLITLIFAKYLLYITARLFHTTISYVMSRNVSFKPIIHVSLHMPCNMLLRDMTWQICHIIMHQFLYNSSLI